MITHEDLEQFQPDQQLELMRESDRQDAEEERAWETERRD